MSLLSVCIAVGLHLQTWVSGESVVCSDTILVFGVRGKDVTLEVPDKKITEIKWTLPTDWTYVVTISYNIATIRPGRDLLTDLDSPLRGRLGSTPEGSLIIKQLQTEDEGTYIASIVTLDEVISVCYELRVFGELLEDEISITSNITSMDPCAMTLICSVDEKNVIEVTWTSMNSSDTHVTGNTLPVSPSSLHSIFICTAINPVSNASKVVLPLPYCPEGVSYCSDVIPVTSVRGKDVTLEIPNKKIREIDWFLHPGGTRITRTRPGRDLDKDLDSPLRGRLASTPEGSLIIKHIQTEDQRKYIAFIITWKYYISLCYEIKVYGELLEDDLSITSNITSIDPCEMTLTCSVDGKNVTGITWTSMNSSDIHVTGNTLLVSSISLHSVFICTASNPASNASKVVLPWTYCPEVTSSTHTRA